MTNCAELHILSLSKKSFDFSASLVYNSKRYIFLYGKREVYFMRAVVAVIGKDTVGILAKVSNICAECNANVMDVTQTIMQDLFAMTMLIDITKCSVDYNVLADKLKAAGNDMGLQIHVMHEDIFNSMHNI
jgi:ACT domain-containing protein